MKLGVFTIKSVLLAYFALLFGATVYGFDYPPVKPGYRIRFPRDQGSHPEFRTEWWYLTGWLTTPAGKPLGFQITFFRMRPPLEGSINPSKFSPQQLLFAHAAVSDPAFKGLLHDQRSARAGFDLAEAREGATHVWINDWLLVQTKNGYQARIPANAFSLTLEIATTQPPILQGELGFSQKAPDPSHASYYYSQPWLKVNGSVVRNGKVEIVSGSAWLDHEWSSGYLPKNAVGWDWAGINLADGGALMLFRMRDPQGRVLWSGGTLRRPDGSSRIFKPDEIRFTPLRTWRSPRTGAVYPVAMRLSAGELEWVLEPLLDDQELDSRLSTGTVYWEGAVRAWGTPRGGTQLGQGYLELTGYWQPLKM